jgi:hypothetical protein
MTEVITPIVRSGDLAALTKALASKRYNINAVDEDGYTALYLACMKEATGDMVPHLIAAGAVVDAKGTDRETPLYIACFNGFAAVAERLVKGGANVNETNGQNKETALHAAARLGYEDVVTFLLSNGANINFRDGNMETPLFQAARANRIEVVYRLLEAGANKSLLNNDTKDALYIASEKGNKGVVELLKADKQHLSSIRSSVLFDERSKPAPLKPTEEYAGSATASDKRQTAPPATNAGISAANAGPAPKKPEPPLDGAKRAASPAKKVTERAAAAGKQPSPKPEDDTAYHPTPVIPIEIPRPEQREFDPLTGKKNAPCKTMIEAGVWEQPPPPKDAIRDFPEMHANYGGTEMVVGAGEDEVAVKRPMFDPEKGDVFDNVILPQERRASTTGRASTG